VSQRTARLDELLREEISGIISRDIHDPRVGFVTVTSVEVAPDLRHATVWVSMIGQPGERKDALRALGHAMPFVRGKLGFLRLKRIPELHLRLDETVERGTRVLDILSALEEGVEPGDAPRAETLPTPVGSAKLPEPVAEIDAPPPVKRSSAERGEARRAVAAAKNARRDLKRANRGKGGR
jgi:ribosome-binding factor A